MPIMNIDICFMRKYNTFVDITNLEKCLKCYNSDSEMFKYNKSEKYLNTIRCYYHIITEIYIYYDANKIYKNISYFNDAYYKLVNEYLNLCLTQEKPQFDAQDKSLAKSYLSLLKIFIENLALYQARPKCIDNDILMKKITLF